jgi:hypothetical protein
MKTSFRLFIPLLLLASGCQMLGASFPSNQAPASQPPVTEDQKELIRKQAEQADQAESVEDEEIDKKEAELKKSLQVALGLESTIPGVPAGESSSKVIAKLRKAKIKLTVEAVKDRSGNAVASDLFEVKDSYTERVQALSRKIAEGTATAAEKREVQEGAKHLMKLNDLRTQLRNVSMAAMMTNTMVQTSSLTTLRRVAGLIGTRKMMEMETSEEDQARLRRWLARQQRVEAIAATAMGVLATYQAVLNDGGNPEAIDILCKNALESLPIRPEVSQEEADNYVKNLSVHAGKIKAVYEQMLRKSYGDARYEQQFKTSLDVVFNQIEGALTQESLSGMMANLQNRYEEDAAKCYEGKGLPPGSPLSPIFCEKARTAAKAGRSLDSLLHSERKQQDEALGGGLFGSLTDMIPAMGVVKASLDGLNALLEGRPEDALVAAAGMIPGVGGSLKKGLELASKALAKQG